MQTSNFSINGNAGCKPAKLKPDPNSIRRVIEASKKKPLKENAIVIARFSWMQKNKLPLPEKMELPNLCLTFAHGKLIRAFYTNVMNHIIKKQNYHIQILN